MIASKRSLTCFFISIVLFAVFRLPGWARSQVIFPERISYKIIKNNKFMGRCWLRYYTKIGKKADNRQLSSLSLKGFEGFDVSKGQWWHTYFFRDDLSLYLDSLLKDKKVISQKMVKEEIDRRGGKYRSFIYKDLESNNNFQTEVYSKYPFINFPSSLIIACQRVAAGSIKSYEKFNFIQGKSMKPARMVYMGEEDFSFQWITIPVKVLAITKNNVEQYRLKIYKDNLGYCFPINIIIHSRHKGTIELKVEEVIKPDISLYISTRPKLFVTHLTFMVNHTQSGLAARGLGGAIDQAVVKGIQKAQRLMNELALNQTGHRIANTAGNVNQLAAILFDPSLTKKEKTRQIIKKIMEPNSVDILVTGIYIHDVQTALITLRPMVIVKSRQNILSRNISFKQEELTGKNPLQGQKSLTKSVFEKIANTVKELLEQV